MKKVFFLILLIGLFCTRECAFSASQTLTLKKINDMYPPLKSTLPSIAATQPQVQTVDFSLCSKRFYLDSQKLFYLTLAGVNANHFDINEIQSRSGYIIFSANKNQFLASVISVNPKISILKITPCSNVYDFSIGIVQNMFRYIELNSSTPIETLGVL